MDWGIKKNFLNKRLLPGVFLAVTLIGLLLYRQEIVFFVRDTTLTNIRPSANDVDHPVCLDNIDTINDVGSAIQMGDSYFGGSAGNDLFCAKRAYEKALEIDYKANAHVLYQLGRIDFLEGKFSRAIFKFSRQVEYFGDILPSVYYMLGLTYGYRATETESDEDWAEAEVSFEKYLELVPESSWAITDLAWLYFSQGKFQEMKDLVKEGIKLYPEHPWLLNMYGLAHLNTGDPQSAYTYFKKSLYVAEGLSPTDWGMSYPGNDPQSWGKGLSEMKEAIQKNLTLAEKQI